MENQVVSSVLCAMLESAYLPCFVYDLSSSRRLYTASVFICFMSELMDETVYLFFSSLFFIASTFFSYCITLFLN